MNTFWNFLLLIAVFDFGTCRNLLRTNEATMQYQSKTKEIKIKVMIHFDLALTRKLSNNSRKDLKLLSKTILSDAENLFKHNSLDQRIRFELIDTKFLKNNTKIVAMDENASRYLRSYCLWQSKKKTKQMFYSVLFTGLDLYYLNTAGKEVRTSTGRGFMGGMCMVKSSCTVIEWKEKNSGYLLAHEIGHSLGMSHDGDARHHSTCSPRGFIMERQYNAQKHPRVWSSCSREELKKYLTSYRGSCLKSNGSRRIRL